MELPLEKPYTEKEIRENMDADGIISGIVGVRVSELINTDLESFLDLVSERLTGSPCLTGTDYKALYMVPDENGDPVVAFRVTGGTELILEDE